MVVSLNPAISANGCLKVTSGNVEYVAQSIAQVVKSQEMARPLVRALRNY
jgi:hypothetical protein